MHCCKPYFGHTRILFITFQSELNSEPDYSISCLLFNFSSVCDLVKPMTSY